MPNKLFTDQMGRSIKIDFPPKRILSLVPSQTELLHYLGLENEVLGITKFCIHPQHWFRSKTRIGGTKQFNFERIDQLNPDLIIGNKEENQKNQIEQLAQSYPVWMSDIKTIDDAFDMIIKLGKLTDTNMKAEDLVTALRRSFNAFEKKMKLSSSKSAAYFIWNKPYMVAASDTFINQMLKIAGFKNCFEDLSRYPEVSLEDLSSKSPEIILLSSEPFPFKERHIATFEKACPEAKTIIVDGELFSWYGSRLQKSISYFETLQAQLS